MYLIKWSERNKKRLPKKETSIDSKAADPCPGMGQMGDLHLNNIYVKTLYKARIRKTKITHIITGSTSEKNMSLKCSQPSFPTLGLGILLIKVSGRQAHWFFFSHFL